MISNYNLVPTCSESTQEETFLCFVAVFMFSVIIFFILPFHIIFFPYLLIFAKTFLYTCQLVTT